MGNTMTESNSVEVFQSDDVVANAIQSLASGKSTVFSTIQGDDFSSKLAVLEATTASLPLSENLNKTIEIADFVIQSIEMVNEETGEMETVPRTIIVATDGTAYHAISKGVFRSVENIVGILGMPNKWAAPLKVKVQQEGQGTRKYFTIRPAK